MLENLWQNYKRVYKIIGDQHSKFTCQSQYSVTSTTLVYERSTSGSLSAQMISVATTPTEVDTTPLSIEEGMINQPK